MDESSKGSATWMGGSMLCWQECPVLGSNFARMRDSSLCWSCVGSTTSLHIPRDLAHLFEKKFLFGSRYFIHEVAHVNIKTLSDQHC